MARSIAAEMHAGFLALRTALPMNLGRVGVSRRIPQAAVMDSGRIDQLWQACLDGSGGPFLFGRDVTIADIMYAPVVARFLSYAVSVSDPAYRYCLHMRALPLVADWYRLAAAEPVSWQLAKYEALSD